MNLANKAKQKKIFELSWPRVRDIQGFASGGKRAACAFITNNIKRHVSFFLGQC